MILTPNLTIEPKRLFMLMPLWIITCKQEGTDFFWGGVPGNRVSVGAFRVRSTSSMCALVSRDLGLYWGISCSTCMKKRVCPLQTLVGIIIFYTVFILYITPPPFICLLCFRRRLLRANRFRPAGGLDSRLPSFSILHIRKIYIAL